MLEICLRNHVFKSVFVVCHVCVPVCVLFSKIVFFLTSAMLEICITCSDSYCSKFGFSYNDLDIQIHIFSLLLSA